MHTSQSTPSKVTWVLEEDHVDNSAERLELALNKALYPIRKVKYYPLLLGEQNLNTLCKPAFFYGSLQLANEVKRTRPDTVFCNLENYKCTHYYPHFQEYMLNDEPTIAMYGNLPALKDDLYRDIGEDDAIFIRPNSGFKLFTGKVVYKESFEHDLDMFNMYDIPPDSIVLISRPQRIEAEWRLFCKKDKIICGSMYKRQGYPTINDKVPTAVLEFGALVASKWQPEPLWTLDICEVAGNYKVVEINSFSCSGLYAADCSLLINAVQEHFDEKA